MRIKLYAHRDKESNFFLEEKLELPWMDVKYVGSEVELIFEYTKEDGFKLIGADGYFLDMDQPYAAENFELDEAKDA